MTKSETNSPQSAGEKLEAPVQLNPEQLEAVAGGMKAQINLGKGTSTTTTGAAPPIPLIKL